MEDDRARRAKLMGLIAGTIFLAIVVVIAIVTRGGDGDEDSAATKLANGCDVVEKPAPKLDELEAPEQVIAPGDELTAIVETSCGTFEIALDTERAPKTSNSFAFLAKEGFYDDQIFHRNAQGASGTFAIQGGDPLGTGTGGPGYSVDEAPPPNLAYTRGIVAMAKSGADPVGRSGSQFFVINEADSGLPPQYALLGKVTTGLDVVDTIAAIPVDRQERLREIVVIESIEIEEG